MPSPPTATPDQAPLKGVILAGGTGSRLRPLTFKFNKHLLPVGQRPMIEHPIGTLVEAGIRDVLIVTGPGLAPAFREALGDGSRLGLERLTFAVQERPAGIADALRSARDFAAGGRVCVMLGDNILSGSIREHAAAFAGQKSGARILLAHTSNPERYGIAVFWGRGSEARLMDLVEKPQNFIGDQAILGVYFYDAGVFDLCASLEPGIRGELEITDVNRAYLRRGDLTWGAYEGWWVDAGTFEDLNRADRHLRGEVAGTVPPPSRGAERAAEGA